MNVGNTFQTPAPASPASGAQMEPPRRLIQIVPSLPPRLEGVGSYALALGETLRHANGPATSFAVADPQWRGSPASSPIHATAIPARRAAALSDALDELARQAGGEGPCPLLIHYSNYGYHPRGCPRWLVDGLDRWQRSNGGHLVTIFHEVYATGRPWQSSFWLSRLQRRLAWRLAALSNGVVTSLDRYASMLAGAGPRREITVLPVFSTVGEPEKVRPLDERRRRLVLFGGRGAREIAFGKLRTQVAIACDRLQLDEIVDIGPPLSEVPRRVGGRPVHQLGLLPLAQVGALLEESLAGFLAYPTTLLPKSTVFAAYAAHGMLPVCAWPAAVEEGALKKGVHFSDPDSSPGAEDQIHRQRIADVVRAWYASHTLAHQASILRRLLAT